MNTLDVPLVLYHNNKISIYSLNTSRTCIYFNSILLSKWISDSQFISRNIDNRKDKKFNVNIMQYLLHVKIISLSQYKKKLWRTLKFQITNLQGTVVKQYPNLQTSMTADGEFERTLQRDYDILEQYRQLRQQEALLKNNVALLRTLSQNRHRVCKVVKCRCIL